VSKITTPENSNLKTSQMLLLTEYKEKCLYDSTAKIMFDNPLIISFGCKYKIKAVLRCKGTYNYTVVRFCNAISQYLQTDLEVNKYFHNKNDGIFQSLMFYTPPFNKPTSCDVSSDEESKTDKPIQAT
jgi:hypothetical protein